MSRRYAITTFLGLVAMFLAAHPSSALAEPQPLDPKPWLAWDQRMQCELVFVGTYASHTDASVSLRVEQPLRGEGLAQGNVVQVALKHWYALRQKEHRPVRRKAGPAAPPKQKPYLIYGHPNWHDEWEYQLPALDLTKRHLFFIRSRKRPVLDQAQQVIEVWALDSWKRVLQGRPADRWFRLWNWWNLKGRNAAWDELAAKPDAGMRARLIRGLLEGGVPRLSNVQAALVRLSRVDPAVYDKVLEAVVRDKTSSRQLQVLAAIDPLRALRDLGPWLRSADASRQHWAAKALSQVKRKEAVVLFAEALRHPNAGQAVANGMSGLVGRAQWPIRPTPGPVREAMELALREHVARLVEDPAVKPDGRRTLKVLHERLIRSRPSLDPKVVVPILKTGAERERRLVIAELLVTCDLRYLDLLIGLARSGKDGTAERAIRCYAWVRPHAFLEAVERLHLAPVMKHGTLRQAWHEARTLLGTPHDSAELFTHVRFHRGFPLTESARTQLARLYPAGGELKPGFQGVDYRDFDWAQYDHQPVLESIRRRTKTLTPRRGVVPLRHLALAVRVGNQHHAKTLQTRADLAIASAKEHEPWRQAIEALWESGDAQLRAHALKILDAGAPGSRGAPRAVRRTGTLQFLARRPFDMPTEFHSRLMEAMRSPDRNAGVPVCDVISTVFGGWSIYPHDAFAHERRDAADRAEATLAAALQAGADDAGAVVLRHLGAKLEGDRSSAWLPELYEIARAGDDRSGVALALVERILGLRGAREFSRHPWGGGWREYVGGLKAWWQDWKLPTK